MIGLKYRTRYANNKAVADTLADGKRTVRIARAHAKEWKLDFSRIGIQGCSAGGDLCLNLAVNHDLGDHSDETVIKSGAFRSSGTMEKPPAPSSELTPATRAA